MIHRRPLNLQHSLLHLFILLYLPNFLWAALSLRTGGAGYPQEAPLSALVVTVPVFAAVGVLLWFLPRRIALIATIAAVLPLSLLATVGIGHYCIYGHGITPSTFYITLSSSFSEAANYAQMYLGWKLLLAAGLFWGVQGALVYRFTRSLPAQRVKGVKGMTCLAVSGFVAWQFYPVVPQRHKMLDESLAAYRLYAFDEEKLRMMRGRNRVAPGTIKVARQARHEGAETYVLVIGESAARSHMGLYGYFRDTTPRLCAMRDRLVLYKDVAASDFCTYLSLRKMLTFANHDDMTPLYDSNLMHIMKAAGFHTYWITNQKSHGTGDIWPKYFSEAADDRFYLNTGDFSDPLDGVLLPPFREVLAQGVEKKFIVVHMMGSHLHASNRYSPEFRRYTSVNERGGYFAKRALSTKEYINHYDNSIRYTDWVLSTLISGLSGSPGRKMLLFLSDHSDQLGEQDDFVGRSYRVNHFQFDIPFFVWASTEYQASSPELYARVRRYAGRPYQADDLIHSFLELADVASPSFDPTRSVFSARFREKKRYMEIPLEPKVNLFPVVQAR